MEVFRWSLYVDGIVCRRLQIGTVLCWGYAIAAFKLLAEVGGSEAHLTGNLGDGHLRMVGEEGVSLFHTDGIDELGEGHTVSMRIEQGVQAMTGDAEALHDLLAL